MRHGGGARVRCAMRYLCEVADATAEDGRGVRAAHFPGVAARCSSAGVCSDPHVETVYRVVRVSHRRAFQRDPRNEDDGAHDGVDARDAVSELLAPIPSMRSRAFRRSVACDFFPLAGEAVLRLRHPFGTYAGLHQRSGGSHGAVPHRISGDPSGNQVVGESFESPDACVVGWGSRRSDVARAVLRNPPRLHGGDQSARSIRRRLRFYITTRPRAYCHGCPMSR